MSVTWEEPTKIHGSRQAPTDWVERLKPLMKKPGRWALIGEVNQGIPSQLRSRKIKRPDGKWEFKGKSSRPGNRRPKRPHSVFLYARYLGR